MRCERQVLVPRLADVEESSPYDIAGILALLALPALKSVPVCCPCCPFQFAVSDMSAPRTQTLARIRELEASLTMARREREGMESSIRQLKESIGSGGVMY